MAKQYIRKQCDECRKFFRHLYTRKEQYYCYHCYRKHMTIIGLGVPTFEKLNVPFNVHFQLTLSLSKFFTNRTEEFANYGHYIRELIRADMNYINSCKGVVVKTMGTLKEEAMASEPPQKTKNISELGQVSTDLQIMEETFTNKDNEEVKYKFVELNGEKYRVPQSVINSLKTVLTDNPNLETFKVLKAGEGMDTRYTLIPLK